jgi:hypothetical protein
MPFWMAGSAVLNLMLLPPFEQLNKSALNLATIAFVIQVVAVVFLLVGPIPNNNRIAKWKPESLPVDRRVQEHCWDLYHWLRTCGLVVAFSVLVLSVGARCAN